MRRGRECVAAATAVAAVALLVPASASAARITVSGLLYRGAVVHMGGAGWSTGLGVCPAGPVVVKLRQGDYVREIGRVAADRVVPLVGGIAFPVRIPADAPLGRVTLDAEQGERRFDGHRGCVRDAPNTAETTAGLTRRPPDAPCPEEGCPIDPAPIMRPAPALPGGGSLAPPPSPCPPAGCSLRASSPPTAQIAQARRFALRPGPINFLEGLYFPTTGPGLCSYRGITFALVDSSGTGHSYSDVPIFADGYWSDRYRMPDTGVADGPGVLLAWLSGNEGHPYCGMPARLPVHIGGQPELLRYDRAPRAGSTLRVVGGWWGTDRCDGPVVIVATQGRRERIVGRIRPGALGGFDRSLRMPRWDRHRPIRLRATQQRLLEVAGRRGQPRQQRCLRARPLSAARARGTLLRTPTAAPSPTPSPAPSPTPAPSPAPSPSPTPSPTPSPQPTLRAQRLAQTLRVTGTGWFPGACEGKDNPVDLRLERESREIFVGTATPTAAGDFDVEFAAAAKPGETIVARQHPCGGGEPRVLRAAVEP